MAILFKCECGAPGMVPDDAAGKQFTCATCGKTGIVPAESSPDCVLVYRNGFPETGQVFDMQELQTQILDFQFTANDLLFHDGTWKPLGEVFEMPEPPAEETPKGEELSLSFNELPPIPGFAKRGQKHPIRAFLKFLKNIMDWQKRARSVKHASAIRKTIYYFVVLVVLVLGYIFGLGRVINYFRWRPAYVLVFNPDDKTYKAELHGKTFEILPMERITFSDIIVAIPIKNTLKLIDAKTGETAYKIKVPLRPNYDVVVNPEGKRKFAIYDLSDVTSRQLKVDLLRKLSNEIVKGGAPTTTPRITAALHDLAMPLYKGTTQDAIFSNLQYNFSRIGLVRSSEYSEQIRKKKPAPPSNLPILVPAGRFNLNFKNATISFDPNVKETPCSFWIALPKNFLPFNAKKYTQRKDNLQLMPFRGSMKLNVTYGNGGELYLAASELSGKVKSSNIIYNGRWIYRATRAADPKNKGKWKWEWSFTGEFRPKGKNAKTKILRLFYEVNYDGKDKLR